MSLSFSEFLRETKGICMIVNIRTINCKAYNNVIFYQIN